MLPRMPVARFALLLMTTAMVVCGSATAEAGVFANVPEAADFELVYTLPIPDVGGGFRDSRAVPYSVDNSARFGPGTYDRIAYYMELERPSQPSEWVYASMDPFQSDPSLRNARALGLPHNANNPVMHQQIVGNMNVVTNVPGKVTPGTGIATGNVEMWPSNYGGNTTGLIPTGSNAFDWNDSGANTAAGHGSFQLHNHGANQVIFAYNDWGGNNTGGNQELGIGNNPGGQPDWTFQDSSHLYAVKNLQVLVRPTQPQATPAQIAANAPEAAGYRLVYELNIGNTAAYNSNGVPYTLNASGQIQRFDRVAYYLELETAGGESQWAYVSMDAFTDDATLLGVPSRGAGANFQQFVENMNVLSNVASIEEGEGIETGLIEFWPNNYQPQNTGQNSGLPAALGVPNASDGLFDFGDRQSNGNYGSMQIHNYDLDGTGPGTTGQTIFAYNNWGAGNGELGIGSRTTSQPDWTFANNIGSYSVKNLYVLVHEVPEPTSLALLAAGGLGLLTLRRRRRR